MEMGRVGVQREVDRSAEGTVGEPSVPDYQAESGRWPEVDHGVVDGEREQPGEGESGERASQTTEAPERPALIDKRELDHRDEGGTGDRHRRRERRRVARPRRQVEDSPKIEMPDDDLTESGQDRSEEHTSELQ